MRAAVLTPPQWIVPGLRGMFIDPSVLSILVKKTFMCKQVRFAHALCCSVRYADCSYRE
jgi:hypothetical protein